MARKSIDSATYQPTRAFEAFLDEMTYQSAWESHYKTVPYLTKHAGKAAKSRGAFYHLGFGKALVLDRFLPSWKESYFKSGVWLDNLLKTAITTHR